MKDILKEFLEEVLEEFLGKSLTKFWGSISKYLISSDILVKAPSEKPGEISRRMSKICVVFFLKTFLNEIAGISLAIIGGIFGESSG